MRSTARRQYVRKDKPFRDAYGEIRSFYLTSGSFFCAAGAINRSTDRFQQSFLSFLEILLQYLDPLLIVHDSQTNRSRNVNISIPF